MYIQSDHTFIAGAEVDGLVALAQHPEAVHLQGNGQIYLNSLN